MNPKELREKKSGALNLLDTLTQTTPASFNEVLRVWTELQFDAVIARHGADLAFSRAYIAASNELKIVNGKEKALTEKEKDHEAFLATEAAAVNAAIADLHAKAIYNLMLRLRDRDNKEIGNGE